MAAKNSLNAAMIAAVFVVAWAYSSQAADCNRKCNPEDRDSYGCCPRKAPPPKPASACNRKCTPQDKDSYGCCPSPAPLTKAAPKKDKVAPAAPAVTPDPPTAREPIGRYNCPIGQSVSEDTNGHCCWAGQAWNGKCVGRPTQCPDTLKAEGEACVGGPCLEGRERAKDGLHCCWAGQVWGQGQGRCLGRPERCPWGMKVDDTGCTTAVPAGMVGLPAGNFRMGDVNGSVDEMPARVVHLTRAIAIDQTEVTVAAYRACVGAGACRAPAAEANNGDDHPVTNVDWTQARAYCAWAGKRLPTEAEWEYAARSAGQQSGAYPWGDRVADCSVAVMSAGGGGCGRSKTWPVCSKPAGNTQQGLCDMAGNVWEWVEDAYDSNAYASAGDFDPLVTHGEKRSVRGGAWTSDYPGYLRSALRDFAVPSTRSDSTGFRCVKSL